MRQPILQSLAHPAAFKEQLDSLIHCSSRVKLSSLYLGSKIDKGVILVDGQRSKREMPLHPNMYYYTTNKYRRYIPFQLNEIGELYHCKLNVFDKQVILTGANLSHDYYTNRQDRYLLVNNHHFADMMDELLAFMVQTNAFQKDIKRVEPLNQKGIEQIQKWAKFQESKLISTFNNKQSGTHLIPVLNWPRLDIKFNILPFLRTHFQDHLFTLSTAYFNPSPIVKDMIKNRATVIAPSIRTHGFYNGKGLKKYIPLLYQHHVNQNKILTYDRTGYTYHAKGLWIKDKDYSVTVIGSNNFGARSAKDVELDFIILSNEQNIVQQLDTELADILQYCAPRNIIKLPLWLQLWCRVASPIL